MKTSLILLLFPSFALAYAERRLSDLAPESAFTVNLRDPELLDKRKREWVQGSAQDGLRCSLSVQSHFDRAAAEAAGPTVYHLTQIHSNDSFNVRNQEGRDQAALWLATDNKDLPYLNLDCFRIYKSKMAHRSPITIGKVETLIAQPRLFSGPVLCDAPSVSAEQFFPDFTQSSRIRLLQALEFQGETAERDRMSVIEPRIQYGKVVDQFEDGSNCRMGYRHSRMENYARIAPAGLEFRIISVRGLSTPDGSQLFDIDLETTDGRADSFQLSCYSNRARFRGFPEYEAHFRSILDFVL